MPLHDHPSRLRRLLAWRWSIVASAILHGLFIGGSIYLSIKPAAPLPDSWEDSVRSHAEAARHAKLHQLPDFAPRIMEDQRRIADAMTDAQKVQMIEEKLPALDKIKTKDVNQIARLIETASAADPKLGEPQSDAKGEIDYDTATVYSVKQRLSKDGSPMYEWVLVDAAGVTLRYEQSEAELSDSERNLVRIFKLTEQNPNLRVLLDTARKITVSMKTRSASASKKTGR